MKRRLIKLVVINFTLIFCLFLFFNKNKQTKKITPFDVCVKKASNHLLSWDELDNAQDLYYDHDRLIIANVCPQANSELMQWLKRIKNDSINKYLNLEINQKFLYNFNNYPREVIALITFFEAKMVLAAKNKNWQQFNKLIYNYFNLCTIESPQYILICRNFLYFQQFLYINNKIDKKSVVFINKILTQQEENLLYYQGKNKNKVIGSYLSLINGIKILNLIGYYYTKYQEWPTNIFSVPDMKNILKRNTNKYKVTELYTSDKPFGFKIVITFNGEKYPFSYLTNLEFKLTEQEITKENYVEIHQKYLPNLNDTFKKNKNLIDKLN